jgi:hypothetical protein
VKTFLIPALLGAALVAVASAAEAGTRSFVVSGGGLSVVDGATANYLGIALPATTIGSAAVAFTLPGNYKRNSPIAAQARFASLDTSCNISLLALGAFRLRPGLAVSNGDGPISGFTMNGSATVALPAVFNRVFTKSFTLRKAGGGPVLNQIAGDNIVLIIGRDGTSGAETCPFHVVLTSVKVTYTTN